MFELAIRARLYCLSLTLSLAPCVCACVRLGIYRIDVCVWCGRFVRVYYGLNSYSLSVQCGQFFSHWLVFKCSYRIIRRVDLSVVSRKAITSVNIFELDRSISCVCAFSPKEFQFFSSSQLSLVEDELFFSGLWSWSFKLCDRVNWREKPKQAAKQIVQFFSLKNIRNECFSKWSDNLYQLKCCSSLNALY